MNRLVGHTAVQALTATRDVLEKVIEIRLEIGEDLIGVVLRADAHLTLASHGIVDDLLGALLGEAVVIPQPGLIPHFFTIIKQHGALLAKGRLLGIQFDTLFTDGLYERIGADAVRYADAIRRAMAENGYLPCFPSPTNQSFCIVSEQQRKELAERVDFSVWEQYDETHSIIRFATSWATREEDVNALCRILRECTAQEKAAS